jgi:flagellar basal body rod protein FlgG
MANATTAGFKADREHYALYWSGESTSALDQARGGPGALPTIESNWIDFTQGAFLRTGAQTHAALSGDGFFAVRRGEESHFTRNGEMQVSAAGTLVNTEGLPMEGVNGQPIRLDGARPFEIRADGSVMQDGAAIGRLRVVSFQDRQQLQKAGHTYFRWPGASDGIQPSRAQVVQGVLESANTGPAEGAVRMVNVLRQFESLQKALQLGTEMSRRLLDDVAKV